MTGSGSRRSKGGDLLKVTGPTSLQSIEMHLSNSTITSLHSLLSHISSDCETLRKRLESCEQILTQMAGCAQVIILQELRQDVSHLAFQSSELEQTCKTLKIASAQFLLLTEG